MFEWVDDLVGVGAVEVGGPVSESVVSDVEARVGGALPPEFRAFLGRFGWLRAGSLCVLGVEQGLEMGGGGVVSVTLAERELEPPLAPGIAVVSEVGNGDFVCVAERVPGVFLALHEPSGEQRAIEPLHLSFDQWLRASVDEQLTERSPAEGWPDLAAVVARAIETGVEVGRGASEAEILAAEATLGVPFPGSYRLWLAACGWMRARGVTLNGLGVDAPVELDVVAATLRQRREVEPPLPIGLIVVCEEKWGSVRCLWTGSDVPFDPVEVNCNREFYPDAIELEEYGNTFISSVESLADYWS